MPGTLIRSLPLGIACCLILVSGAFMLNAAARDAAIMDELPHIPAGYSYVRFLDYRLNPEHPPLLKALAALPLLALQPAFPLNSEKWASGVNEQWDIGRIFLYQLGNDADLIVFLARLGPLLLTLLLILLTFLWSRELLGHWWALLPTFLVALSPTVLAHGHYVTTDIGATFGTVLALYLFLKYLLHPRAQNLLLAGIGFGIAQLLKFSLVLLVPYFICIVGAFWLSETFREGSVHRIRRAFRGLLRHARALFVIFAIGYILVYAAYALFTAGYPPEKQIADTEYLVRSFESPPIFPRTMETLVQNPAARPFAHYLLGLSMVFSRASGGNTGYFLGMVTNLGWWYYFPVVFLLKEPLPALLLILGTFLGAAYALAKWLFRRGRMRALQNYLGTHFTEFSIFVFIAIYWAASIRSPLNIGVRHILPTLPLIYIVATAGLKHWLYAHAHAPAHGGTNIQEALARITAVGKAVGMTFLKVALIGALLVWYAGETVAVAPYFLSYFNQIGGGTPNGYRYVVDSNYDWGQDLKELASWARAMRQNPENGMEKIAVDYFGGGDPAYYIGKDIAEGWWPARGNPADIGIRWLAVSVNSLQGGLSPTVRGFTRKPEDEYSWLVNLRGTEPGLGGVPKPDYRIGTSIFIYKL